MKRLSQAPVLLAALLMSTAFGTAPASAYTAPYTTPRGVTVVVVTKGLDDAVPQFLWRRLGDATGKPVYTFDADQKGQPTCVDACAKDFTPFVADAEAEASGDFSIVVRADKARQWAYQGKPLYHFTGADPAGEPVGARIALKEDPAWVDPASDVFSPKSGWRRTAFAPETTMVMPSNVELASLGIADGFGFVDAATRMTIYAVPVSHPLTGDWRPVRASAMARPLGEFTIITRADDSTLQWAYKGEALYTYAGDHAPNEANGLFTGDRSVHVALAYRNFMPPGFKINSYPGRGPLLTNEKGMTLYFISRYQLQYGGRESREGFLISYNDAKSQGVDACVGECNVSWIPFLAPAKATGWGFWETIARPDGKLQWAYKGSPLYTYIGDQKPGDVEGNNRTVILFGGSKGEVVYGNPGRDPRNPNTTQPRLGSVGMDMAGKDLRGFNPGQKSGAGFYWHTVGLFN